MPNRTIYLPDELDEWSKRLGLNLSQITQAAIADQVDALGEEGLEMRARAASDRIEALGLTWPAEDLAAQRVAAGER